MSKCGKLRQLVKEIKGKYIDDASSSFLEYIRYTILVYMHLQKTRVSNIERCSCFRLAHPIVSLQYGTFASKVCCWATEAHQDLRHAVWCLQWCLGYGRGWQIHRGEVTRHYSCLHVCLESLVVKKWSYRCWIDDVSYIPEFDDLEYRSSMFSWSYTFSAPPCQPRFYKDAEDVMRKATFELGSRNSTFIANPNLKHLSTYRSENTATRDGHSS